MSADMDDEVEKKSDTSDLDADALVGALVVLLLILGISSCIVDEAAEFFSGARQCAKACGGEMERYSDEGCFCVEKAP